MSKHPLRREADNLSSAARRRSEVTTSLAHPASEWGRPDQNGATGSSGRSLPAPEAQGGNAGERAEPRSSQSATGALGGILDYRNSVQLTQIAHRVDVGWISVEMRNHDCVNSPRYDVPYRFDVGTQRLRIQIVQPDLHTCLNSRSGEIDTRIPWICNYSTGRNDCAKSEN